MTGSYFTPKRKKEEITVMIQNHLEAFDLCVKKKKHDFILFLHYYFAHLFVFNIITLFMTIYDIFIIVFIY